MPKQNVPALRLGGFDGEWETTSIGTVSTLHNGRDYKHLGEGWIPVYGTGGYMVSVDQALSHDKDAVGIGRKGTINKPYILKAPFWTVDTLFYVVPNQDTDLAFFYASVLQVDWMAKNTATGLPSLTSQAINSADISVPHTLEEQQAIGAIFTNLDAAINQHTLKHKALQQAKTALMQRMFPQEGQTVPELRLEGFSGKWSEHNFLDLILKIIDFRGRTPKKLGMEWSEAGYLALSANNVKQGFIDLHRDAYFGDDALYSAWMSGNELHKGQVLFTTEAPMGNVAQVPDNRKYILSQRVIAFSVKPSLLNDDFLRVLLGSPVVSSHLESLTSGGTAKGVSQNSLSRLVVVIPESLEEQQAIGAVFTQLDTLIAAEAQYIDSLKQAKTALLQRMFI